MAITDTSIIVNPARRGAKPVFTMIRLVKFSAYLVRRTATGTRLLTSIKPSTATVSKSTCRWILNKATAMRDTALHQRSLARHALTLWYPQPMEANVCVATAISKTLKGIVLCARWLGAQYAAPFIFAEGVTKGSCTFWPNRPASRYRIRATTSTRKRARQSLCKSSTHRSIQILIVYWAT